MDFDLPAPLHARLAAVARETQTTMFMVLQTGLVTLLADLDLPRDLASDGTSLYVIGGGAFVGGEFVLGALIAEEARMPAYVPGDEFAKPGGR